MKLLKFVFYVTLFIFISSCKHTTEYFEIDDSPEEIDFTNFHIEFFNPDSFHIVSNEDFIFEKMSVNEIVIYEQPIDTSVLYTRYRPTFKKVAGGYRLIFDIPVIVSSPIVKYNIYFILLNNEYAQVDTTISYINNLQTNDVKIEFSLHDIPDWSSQYPDDGTGYQEYLSSIYWEVDAFDISENFNYWVFRVDDEFFGWDRNANSVNFFDYRNTIPRNDKTVLKSTLSPWGEDVAFYNNILYFDMYGDVSKVDFSAGSYTNFFGNGVQTNIIDDYTHYTSNRLAVNSNSVYLLIRAQDSPTIEDSNWVIVFDHEGNILKKIKWEEQVYYKGWIEEHNGIIYGYIIDTHELVRYDIDSETFLSRVKMPSNYSYGGFRIIDDRFYYIDWNFEIMMSFPLSNIIN